MLRKLLHPTYGWLVLLLVLIFSCKKEADETPLSPSNSLPEEKTVVASLQGKVVDENGDPVAGATVASGAASTTTDANGIFNFNNIHLSSRWGYVKVIKDGYFAGSRSIVTGDGDDHFVSIRLTPRSSKGTFAGTAGGVISVQGGDSVVFDASSIVNAATGAGYSGVVHVYAAYLDPMAEDVAQRMPGDLRGVGSDGKETLLQSFGMMVVEMEGDAGERLQIAGGKTASIRMKIPDALKETAPATIPLWYFNDTTGRWIQQGSANRHGNYYVGQVPHFSWWNCDAPTGLVSFHVRLRDRHDNPLPFTYLKWSSATMGTRGGFTDAEGNASGLIPKGQVLRMEAVNNCGNVLVGLNAGPALTDLDMGVLTVADDRAILTLTGTAVDCEGVAVDSGYVSVMVEGQVYRAHVVKGAFSVAIARCSDAATDAVIFSGNYKTSQQSDAVLLSVTTGSMNAGQLKVCGGSLDQYFNISFKGKDYHITLPWDTECYGYSDRFYGIVLDSSGNSEGVDMAFFIRTSEFAGVGTYNPVASTISISGEAYYQKPDPGTDAMKCVIMQFGPLNGAILGRVTGIMFNNGGAYPFTCDFKVARRGQ